VRPGLSCFREMRSGLHGVTRLCVDMPFTHPTCTQ
jgi:hypothetical protein